VTIKNCRCFACSKIQTIIHSIIKFTKAQGYLVLKIILVGLCLIFLYQRTRKIVFSEFKNLFVNSFTNHWELFLLAFLLVFVNWGIEAKKWKYLINRIEKISFLKAFYATMAGIAISSFTPNRVGEFAGRMMFLKNKTDTRVVALTIIGSMSQLLMTLIIGLPGFIQFLMNNQFFGLKSMHWINIIVILLPMLIVILFWNIPNIFNWFKNHFKENNMVKYITEGTSFINRKGLWYISMLSLSRYLVFCFQYILILLFFEVDMLWWQYALFVPAIFLIQSIVPSFVITEIGIRVSVALGVFQFCTSPISHIVAASTMLWVVNLMIPSIFGAFTLLTTKLESNN